MMTAKEFYPDGVVLASEDHPCGLALVFYRDPPMLAVMALHTMRWHFVLDIDEFQERIKEALQNPLIVPSSLRAHPR
jgi:hypothetical protein